MRNILIDDFSLLDNKYFNKFQNNFFLTSNPAVYKFLKNKKQEVSLISEIETANKQIKISSKFYKEFHNLLFNLDNDKNLDNLFEKKNLNLFYNSFRYLPFIYYAGFKYSIHAIKTLSKKKKIKTIYCIGELDNPFFDKFILYDELKSIKINLKIEKNKKKKLNFIKFFNKLNFNFIKLLNIELIKRQIRKLLSKNLIFRFRSKNLVIEPLFDYFYYNFDIKKNIIINIDKKLKEYKIDKNEIDIIEIKKVLEKTFIKNKKKFSKKILKKLIIEAYEINKKSLFLINYLNSIFQKFKLKKIIWCCDPDSHVANIISYFRNKKIQIIGIQHGGGYLLQNFNLHHIHSDLNFCDRFLSYGSSKKFRFKNVIQTGCLRDLFFKKNFDQNEKKAKNLDFMYIPNPIFGDYFFSMSKPSFEKIKLQDEIIDLIKKYKSKKIIKFPNNPRASEFPLLLDKDKLNNFYFVNKKIYQSLNIYNPKIIILDHLSTSIYECLFSESEIILFLDQYNMPKNDVIYYLKKRVHIIYEFSELNVLVDKIINKKIMKKRNNEFRNMFFSMRNRKVLKNLLD